jgi:hypothetical protein
MFKRKGRRSTVILAGLGTAFWYSVYNKAKPDGQETRPMAAVREETAQNGALSSTDGQQSEMGLESVAVGACSELHDRQKPGDAEKKIKCLVLSCKRL